MGDKETIQEYKNSYNPIIFGEAKNPDSDYFYPTNLRKWKDIRLEELRNIGNFSSRFPLLKSYIIALRNLGLKIGELYESLESKKNSTLILIKQHEILDQLGVIASLPTVIKKNIVSGEANLAYKLKTYCLDLFDEFLKNILNEEMGISLKDSPLGIKFLRVYNDLSDSVNLDEVKALEVSLINESKKTRDPSTETKISIQNLVDDRGAENQNDIEQKIISEYDPNLWNEMGYLLFNYLNDNYLKSGKVKYINIHYFLRNYSSEAILYYMTQAQYTEFIVEKFDIVINKFEKAKYLFGDKELPKLRQLERNFHQSFK